MNHALDAKIAQLASTQLKFPVLEQYAARSHMTYGLTVGDSVYHDRSFRIEETNNPYEKLTAKPKKNPMSCGLT